MCIRDRNETLDSTSEGIKEDQNALLSENKSNRDKEKMMHIEINIKRVQKQIIKKTKERRIILYILRNSEIHRKN